MKLFHDYNEIYFFLNTKKTQKKYIVYRLVRQVRKTTYVIILYDMYIAEGLEAGRIYFPYKLLSDIFRQNENTRWEFGGRENKERMDKR